MMRKLRKAKRARWVASVAVAAMLATQAGMPLAYAQNNLDARFRANVSKPAPAASPSPSQSAALRTVAGPNDDNTVTPIKHVILIIGENRSFDHTFATYIPLPGQTVHNLLSEGVVNIDGTPGPNFDHASQKIASDRTVYSNSPKVTGKYSILPPQNTDGAPTNPHFATVAAAEAVEPALPDGYYVDLTIGGTGQPNYQIDNRFPLALQNGPVPMDNYLSYDDYAASPVHRFFQMWQETDCNIDHATPGIPSGCLNDLFPWTEVTIGAGSNGEPQPKPFTDETTGEGSTSMQFFNVAQGDVPYFTQLALQYALSDNMHQSVEGGTGANHIMLGYGSPIYYAKPDGGTGIPPSGQIENPNPQPGTNNYYTEDGYGYASAPYENNGGSYVDCSDTKQPGVEPIKHYLNSLPYVPFRKGDCAPNAYYLVNNYNPGYFGTGEPAPLGPDQFTIPPSTQPNLGTMLNHYGVSWKYYGEGWDGGSEDGENGTYCNICDPFLYSTEIMTSATQRQQHLADVTDLYNDITAKTLPAVSIVKPDGYLDGHPASSKLELFEGFCQKIIEMVQLNPTVWANTAIVITFDEGGGFWDSGYIQPIDFFGDGTRIPLLVVSPYSTGGRVVHTYFDHVSFDKFVEANWRTGRISKYSRDNLPNPVSRRDNRYAPANSPAIGDLMDMFVFRNRPRA
jgi:phospholipase C